MVVYGDLLFLINFSMDFLCFYISCLLLHKKMPTVRVCLSACLGGVYSVASLFISVGKTEAVIIDMSVLLLMCCTVYLDKNESPWGIFKGAFLYFFVSALLGGLMTALFSLFNRAEIFAKDMGMNDDVDMWIFAFLTVIGSLITVKGGRIFRSSSTSRTVSLEIEGDYGSLEFNALVDSGNLATEPISGKSVVFANIEKSKMIIGETMYNVIKNSSDINDISIELLSKIRIIPTHAVSGKRLLPALKLKNVRITQGRRKKDIDVYIAFVDDEFLPGYDAIISEEAII